MEGGKTEPPRMSNLSASRRAVRALLALSLGLGLAALAAEAATRVVLRASGKPHSAWLAREAQRGQLQWVSQRRAPEIDATDAAGASIDTDLPTVLSPYLGYDYPIALRGYASDSHYFTTEQARQNFDVLVLGGSVAGSVATHAVEAISASLGADPRLAGRTVRVHNHGRGGYKAPQPSIFAGFLFELGMRPDLVLLIDGFNEVAIGNANRKKGTHPIYPSLGHWKYLLNAPFGGGNTLDQLWEMRQAQRRMGTLLEQSLHLHLYYSAFGTYLVESLIDRARSRYARAHRAFASEIGEDAAAATVRGPVATMDLEQGMEAITEIWVESSRNLAGMCRQRGIPFVHVLQPTLHDPGSKPITEAERKSGHIEPDWLEGVVHGYPLLRGAGERLRDGGIAFFDASRLLAGEERTLYYDACHFIPQGCEILGRYCAESAAGALPPAGDAYWSNGPVR
jgi:hypothetical protein